jgi:CheY-like chemotaxis protein
MPRILVIDDSASALQIVEAMLAGAGHQVHACREGRNALQVLRREAFDLVVTDIYMPDEDGLEVIRESRRICPNVPVVAMSGMTGNRNMLAVAKYLGACQTVTKPLSAADLLAAVEAALGPAPHGHQTSTPASRVGTPHWRDRGPDE